MKVIFLDIDGVLLPLWTEWRWWRSEWRLTIPQSCAEALYKIAHHTDSMIVISSSWRHHMESCKDLLDQIADFKYQVWWKDYVERIWDRVISRTPSKTDGGRSTEILMWIDEYHRSCKTGHHITHWIAIDDEWFDMKAIKRIGKLIKTDPNIWLTDEDAELVISLLS